MIATQIKERNSYNFFIFSGTLNCQLQVHESKTRFIICQQTKTHISYLEHFYNNIIITIIIIILLLLLLALLRQHLS
jgi:hypothetical protein